MKDGEPCTSRGVSTVLEGVTPRPRTKGSMAWRFLPYELYTMQRYLQYGTLAEVKTYSYFDAVGVYVWGDCDCSGDCTGGERLPAENTVCPVLQPAGTYADVPGSG